MRDIIIALGVVLALTLFGGVPRASADFGPIPAPTAVVVVQPNALSNGHLSTTSTMSDGSQVTYDGGVPNGVQLTNYDPVAYPITTGSTTQLRGGYVVYDLTGSGIVAAATVKLPASPVDRQVARVALLGSWTLTALVVQDASGAAIGTYATLISTLGSTTILFQYQGSAWQRIGS